MNYRYSFLMVEEIKKIFRAKYFSVYIVVLLLDIVAFISEYSDRSRSVLYSTGVRISGQGMMYLLSHEFGSFGVLILYLLPVLFISAPVFSDESENKILDQIRVTENGRRVDVILKTRIIFIIQLVWLIFLSFFSTILSFVLFDNGIIGIRTNIIQIIRCMINIYLGGFCISSLLLFMSSCLKSTVASMAVGFALIIFPMFVKTENIWGQFFPVFGMQAENLIKRSVIENIVVYGFYIICGGIFFLCNISYNK